MSNVIALRTEDLTPDTRVIFVTVKNVYGNELIYPACDDSRKFAELMGKKTLSTNDLRGIKSLGYSVALAQSVNLPEILKA